MWLYEADQEARHRELLWRIAEQQAEFERVARAARDRFVGAGREQDVAVPQPAASYTFDTLEVGNVELALGARFRDVGFQQGAVDAFQVYDRQLTPLEVARVCQQPLPTDEAAHLAHYLARADQPCQSALQRLQQSRLEENELSGQVRQVVVMQE